MGLKDIFNKKNDDEGLNKDALNYFRDNNDEFFSVNQWLKVILVGVVTAIVLGIAYGYFGHITGYNISLVLIGLGFVLATIMKKITGVGNKRLAIVAVCCYLIVIVISLVSFYAIEYASIGSSSVFSSFFEPDVWSIAFEVLLDPENLYNAFIYLIGAFATFQYASHD